MIHSLSGGVLSEDGYHTVVKVKFFGEDKVGYFLCDDFRVSVGDKVVVESLGCGTEEGEVLRVDKNVSEKCSPVPVKRARKVLKKL